MKVSTTQQLLRMSTPKAVAFASSCGKGEVRERMGIYPGSDSGEPMDIKSNLTSQENIHVYLLLEQHGVNPDGTYNDKNCAALGHCWGKSKTDVKFVHAHVRNSKEKSEEIALLLGSFPQTGSRGRAMTVFLLLAVALAGFAAVFTGFGGIDNRKEPFPLPHLAKVQKTLTHQLAAWTNWPHKTEDESEDQRICRVAANALLAREAQLASRENALERRARELAAAETAMDAREEAVLRHKMEVLGLASDVDDFYDKAGSWKSGSVATVNSGIETLESLLDKMKELKLAMRDLKWSTGNAVVSLHHQMGPASNPTLNKGDADRSNNQVEDH